MKRSAIVNHNIFIDKMRERVTNKSVKGRQAKFKAMDKKKSTRRA